jgi:hypothetical protein
VQVSGLEEEFQRSGELPRLLYIEAPVQEREPRLANLLARIREDAWASYRTWFADPKDDDFRLGPNSPVTPVRRRQ